jgi:cytochrome c oxidase cbb3-type subunit 3
MPEDKNKNLKNNHPDVDVDKHSGVETTGHEWDGIKELNNPLPRWWLWIFYACIVWAFGYWVVYPAWPTLSGNTKGSKGWTQYTKLQDEQAEINAIRKDKLEKIKSSSLTEIKANPELYSFAIAGGNAAFKENCAACHGTGAAGSKGYPNLNDDDWLWGKGTLDDIHQTLQYGIRSGHEMARDNAMPAFGKDGILTASQISDVADYVVGLSSVKVANAKGEQIFAENCVACHGEGGKGNPEMGAPNLADAIWLYGGDKAAVTEVINNARKGVMPNWGERLDEATLKQLTIYVHSLGGGK